ncbi:MAG: flagellin [Pseudomonadota bacterium]
MSSILTNNSAMVALQTLNTINKSLLTVQDQISTGKAVGSARDNSAVWAISSVMKSDVEGFKGISESLSLGASTVAVGRQATETVTGLLTEIKSKIVSAQEENVDRSKIQTDIASLRDQITSVVNTAQFNGLNLLKGQDAVSVLSSLNRSSDGTVTSSSITVQRQNLETNAATFGAGASLDANATASAASITNAANTTTLTIAGTVAASDVATLNINGTDVTFTAANTSATDVATGLTAAINASGITGVTATSSAGVITLNNENAFTDLALSANGDNSMTTTLAASTVAQRAENVTFELDANVTINAGDSYRVSLGGNDYDYIAKGGDTFNDIASGLKSVVDAAGLVGVTTEVQTTGGGAARLAIDNSGGTGVSLAASGKAGGTVAGGLNALSSIDVSTSSGATSALSDIEGLIQTAIDASAEFGSVERRIDIQGDFVSTLSGALTSGIGALVDADMEAASARLQALQVQQQLGIQALSIANQAPQNILGLFR